MKAFGILLQSGSGNNGLLKAITLLLLLAFAVDASAQREEEFNIQVKDQIKDVTAAGPYPLYLRFQGLLSMANTDALRCFRVYDKYEGQLATPITMWGFDTDAGFRLRQWFFEMGFTQVGRKAREDGVSLRVREQFASARLGYALSVYYPISFQFHAGYVTGFTEIILTDPASAIPKRKLGFGESVFKGRPGLELGLRFVLMDPVGAGGGMGIAIEYKHMHFFKSLDYSPLARALDDAAIEKVTSDNTFGIFSISVIAPIAYRLNTTR